MPAPRELFGEPAERLIVTVPESVARTLREKARTRQRPTSAALREAIDWYLSGDAGALQCTEDLLAASDAHNKRLIARVGELKAALEGLPPSYRERFYRLLNRPDAPEGDEGPGAHLVGHGGD